MNVVDGRVEAGDDRGDSSAFTRAARMQHSDQVKTGGDDRGIGKMQVVGIRSAAVALDPTGDRFFRRSTDSHDQLELVAQDHVVEQLLAMLGDRRGRVLSDDRQQPVVLPEDGVHEGVEEEVRPVDPDVRQQVLHPSTCPASERTMTQRFVLRALLTDDQYLDLLVTKPSAVEHRSEMPAELLVARQRDADAAIVRCLGEEP